MACWRAGTSAARAPATQYHQLLKSWQRFLLVAWWRRRRVGLHREHIDAGAHHESVLVVLRDICQFEFCQVEPKGTVSGTRLDSFILRKLELSNTDVRGCVGCSRPSCPIIQIAFLYSVFGGRGDGIPETLLKQFVYVDETNGS